MNRRGFLRLAPAIAGAARSLAATDARISVFLNEPIGTVSPYLHGHFIEHLGGVIYDGVWVGENSKIPNIGGVRKALVEAMRPLGATVMRYPGGCFADSYDWRDGIGPAPQRPRKPNFWSNSGILKDLPLNHPARSDPNTFGTREFIRFCRLINAEPYLAANLRSLPARDFHDWIDYCNAPAGASSLGDRRAANGDPQPYDVRFWGVGNESWGCGGDLTAGEYSVEFRKFTAWTPRYQNPLSFIAAGPNGGEPKWTREFFARMADKDARLLARVWGWALHYYCGTTGKSSIDFTTADALELLNRANRMEELIGHNWQIMGEYDKSHSVKLVVDEWGAWHKDTTAPANHLLFGSLQTMRDAVIAGLTLDTFHRHADKIAMANVAQLINCIQTLFLATGDQFCVTPAYHVFAMYRAHHNGQSLRTEFAAPRLDYEYENQRRSLARLAGSASLKDKLLTVTGVNTSASDPLPATVDIHGGSATECRAQVLSAPDIRTYNSFAQPNAVKPSPLKIEQSGATLRLSLPPMSVVKIEASLA